MREILGDEARAIGALYNRSLRLMRGKAWDRRRLKRSRRIARQAFARWFKLKGMEPHAPATFDAGPPIWPKGEPNGSS